MHAGRQARLPRTVVRRWPVPTARSVRRALWLPDKTVLPGAQVPNREKQPEECLRVDPWGQRACAHARAAVLREEDAVSGGAYVREAAWRGM